MIRFVKILVMASLFGVLVPRVAFAEDIDILQIETRMEERLTRLVQMVDPQGQVVVKAILKKAKSQLPGVSSQALDIFEQGRFRKVEIDDVREFQIIVISTQDKMPAWLSKEIEQTATFQGVKKSISYTKEMIESKTLADRISTDWMGQLKTSAQFGFWGFFCLGGAIAAALFLVAWMIWSGLRMVVRDHIRGLKTLLDSWSESAKSPEIRGQETASAGKLSKDRDQDPDTHHDEAGKGEFDTFSDAALTNLIADCYWSELDRYAAWIWLQLPGSKRQVVVQNLPFGFAYAKYIYELEAQSLNFHRDPAYLKACHTNFVSNSDLQKMLVKTPALWNSLSEMRQSRMQLSLSQRLEMEKQRAVTALAWDESKFGTSPLRDLPMTLGKMELTLQDEDFILENGEAVPNNIRHNLKSLVWLNSLEDAQIRDIFNSYSAEDIASVWVGPERVLKRIEQNLPEKKFKMVMEFRERIEINRNSFVMSEITERALASASAPGSLSQNAA